MKKIILYHGTDIETAKKISKSGLKPTKSHWDNCPSHDDHVYLTDTFPIRYGISKSTSSDLDEQKINLDAADDLAKRKLEEDKLVSMNAREAARLAQQQNIQNQRTAIQRERIDASKKR